jgi:hypothetical protein
LSTAAIFCNKRFESATTAFHSAFCLLRFRGRFILFKTMKTQIQACRLRALRGGCWIWFFAGWLVLISTLSFAAQKQASRTTSPINALVGSYCADCHDEQMKKGGLDLDSISGESVTQHSKVWEKVIRRLTTRQMPPVGKERPSDKNDEVIAKLAASLDSAAEKQPNPGRTETFRRLNRTEYQNAIRDLLSLEIDAAALLPKDDASYGFDNVGVANLSPTLLNRYIAAAESAGRRRAAAQAWRRYVSHATRLHAGGTRRRAAVGYTWRHVDSVHLPAQWGV